MSAIQEREAQRVKVLAELSLLDSGPGKRFDLADTEQARKGYLSDWGHLASRNSSATRQVLRKLLPSRIKLSHESDGTYRFSGTVALGRMLTGLVGFHRGKWQGKLYGAPGRN